MTVVANKGFIPGSIKRETFKDYNRRYLYRYRNVVADLVNNNTYVHDELIFSLSGKLPSSQVSYYNMELKKRFLKLPDEIDQTDEQWYTQILEARKQCFTEESLKIIRCEETKDQLKVHIDGINQYDLLHDYAISHKELYIFITEWKYIEFITKIVNDFSQGFRTINICTNDSASVESPYMSKLIQDYIKENAHPAINHLELNTAGIGFELDQVDINDDAVIVGLGEWCLSAFKNLNLDSFVFCESNEIITRGLTCAQNKKVQHCIYVPREFDIVSKCKIVEKTIFNYQVYDRLSNKYGTDVYRIPFIELLNKYPSVFMCYDTSTHIDMDYEKYNMNSVDEFYDKRFKIISNAFEKSDLNIELEQHLANDQLNNPMRVTSALINLSPALKLEIESFNRSENIRNYVRNADTQNGLITNFLFFTTEKSINTFNKLRSDRPEEQYYKHGWHIDYLKNDNQHSLPLYNKAMIGLTKEGDFEFKRAQMGPGVINIKYKNKHSCLNWSAEHVNSNLDSELQIFTPHYDTTSTEEYMMHKCPIGTDRINIIYINGKITAIRSGFVLLPSIGIVISMNKAYWKQLFGDQNFNENGYLNIKNWSCSVELRDSEKYEWAYGGGMFLIYDGEVYDSEQKLQNEFRKEGWLSNMSKQTQDSETFRLDKHPRTAIGLTEDNKLFVFVVSGRSKYSVGANYLDLIEISKDLFGNVKYLMNLDGGASSFMGVVKEKEVFVVSDITFTNDSCAGELRSLNSLLSITNVSA